MKRFINGFISLSIAMFYTLTMILGVSWLFGETAIEFKCFGGLFLATGIVIMAYNFIKSFGDTSYF